MSGYSIYFGIIGMLLLLAAFALNLMRNRTEDSYIYINMNIIGAGMSAYYAILLDAIPFVILEAVWCLFAVYKLLTKFRKTGDNFKN
ncbi:MAG: hypothetical protein ABIJ45_05105 [Candidatus Zixiibacteriota bacterium]